MAVEGLVSARPLVGLANRLLFVCAVATVALLFLIESID